METSIDTASRQSRLLSDVRELFHQTSPIDWECIRVTGNMKRGDDGWAEDGVYFAESPEATMAKANLKGVIIRASVKLGHYKEYEPGDRISSHFLAQHHFDSVFRHARSGNEWAVFNSDQVTILAHSTDGGRSWAPYEYPVGMLCRVPGCTSCEQGRAHYCRVCRDVNSTHHARDCPQLSRRIPQGGYCADQME